MCKTFQDEFVVERLSLEECFEFRNHNAFLLSEPIHISFEAFKKIFGVIWVVVVVLFAFLLSVFWSQLANDFYWVVDLNFVSHSIILEHADTADFLSELRFLRINNSHRFTWSFQRRNWDFSLNLLFARLLLFLLENSFRSGSYIHVTFCSCLDTFPCSGISFCLMLLLLWCFRLFR